MDLCDTFPTSDQEVSRASRSCRFQIWTSILGPFVHGNLHSYYVQDDSLNICMIDMAVDTA